MSPLLPGTHQARRAFTLIELLTVIAIIGILAAIIIPTVGKVRESAKSSQCLSNQRQIAMAFGLYANDNRGYFPRAGIAPDNTSRSWMIAVKDYLPARGNVVTHKIFVCPSEEHQAPGDYTSSVFNYSASFALENGNSVNALNGEGSPPAGPRLLSSIVRPSRTLLIVDGVVDPSTYRANSARSWGNVTADLALSGPNANGFVALRFRHGAGMNAAYVDGHAAKILWGDRHTAIPDQYAWNGKQ